MENFFLKFVAAIAAFIIITGCSDPDKQAEAILEDASDLIISAMEIENENYSEAFKRYSQALNNLETIINDYPTSYLSSAIFQNEIHAGEYSYTQLKETILPIASLKASGEKDLFSCALYIFCATQDEVDKDFLLVELSKAFSASGRYEDAIEINSHINEPFYKIRALNALADRILESGDNYKALGILSEAHNMALHLLDDNTEKTESLSTIACIYAKANASKKAGQIFKRAKHIAKQFIKERENKVYALAHIASKLSEASWYDNRFWMGAMALRNELRDEPFVFFMSHETIIRGHIKSGKYAEALEQLPLLEEKLASIFTVEKRDRCNAKMACIYGELHKSEEAEQHIDLVSDPYLREKAIATIAGFQAGAGDFQMALEKAYNINDLSYKASALIQIVTRQPNYKQMVDETTVSLLRSMISEISKADLKLCNMETFHKYGILSKADQKENIPNKVKANKVLQDTKHLAKTPEEAVKKLYRSAISGDTEAMKRYLIASEYILRSNPEQLRRQFVGYGDEKLLDAETYLIEENEYTAKVLVEFKYKDRTEAGSKPIILEYKDGGWKIIYP